MNLKGWHMTPYLPAWVFRFAALWLIKSLTFKQILRTLHLIHTLIRLSLKLQTAHRAVWQHLYYIWEGGVCESPRWTQPWAMTHLLADAEVTMKCRSNRKDCINVTLIIISLNLGHFSHHSKIKCYQMVMSVWKCCRKTFHFLMTPLWVFSADCWRLE